MLMMHTDCSVRAWKSKFMSSIVRTDSIWFIWINLNHDPNCRSGTTSAKKMCSKKPLATRYGTSRMLLSSVSVRKCPWVLWRRHKLGSIEAQTSKDAVSSTCFDLMRWNCFSANHFQDYSKSTTDSGPDAFPFVPFTVPLFERPC